MRRLWPAVALATLAACGTPPPAPSATPPTAVPPAAAQVPVRVIAFNDFHGHLESGSLSITLPDPSQPAAPQRAAAGGAAALAGLVQALRQGVPHSVLASTGDMIGATPLVSALFRHESTVEVLNQMGVDVAVAGNHEFDAGTTELLRVLGGGCAPNVPDAPTVSCAVNPRYLGARFPVLAANVRAGGKPLLPPTWVVSVGGVRVGFIGAVTRSTPSFMPTSTDLSKTNSETRKPLAYISSSIVRSRKPSGVPTSGAASNASTCCSDKVLGKRGGCLADLSRTQGSTLMR
jgi:5'-nucleotidase